MSLLAEPILFDEPPASYLSTTPGPAIVKRLAWYGLAPDTWKGYATPIDLFEDLCMLCNKKPWPASTHMLEEWAGNCIFRSTLPKQGSYKEYVTNGGAKKKPPLYL